jgi:hypothetical protein
MSQGNANRVELQTHDRNAQLVLDEIGRFADGSGYRCKLIVRSSGFACERPFYFQEWNLKEFLSHLDRMNTRLSGDAVLKQEHEPDFVKLQVDGMGHVFVSGEVHLAPTHQLKFEFRSDQTCLGPLMRDLEAIRRPDA